MGTACPAAGKGLDVSSAGGTSPSGKRKVPGSRAMTPFTSRLRMAVYHPGPPPCEWVTSTPGPDRSKTAAMADFLRLTEIPILVLFGDNIPEERTEVWGLDNWRVRLRLARRWAETVNRHGGDVTVLSLPDAGLHGNTHFLMSDLNTREVADLMERWMETHHLDGKEE